MEQLINFFTNRLTYRPVKEAKLVILIIAAGTIWLGVAKLGG